MCTDPVWMGLATGLTLSEVSVAGLLGIRESSSYSFGKGTGVYCRHTGVAQITQTQRHTHKQRYNDSFMRLRERKRQVCLENQVTAAG